MELAIYGFGFIAFLFGAAATVCGLKSHPYIGLWMVIGTVCATSIAAGFWVHDYWRKQDAAVTGDAINRAWLVVESPRVDPPVTDHEQVTIRFPIVNSGGVPATITKGIVYPFIADLDDEAGDFMERIRGPYTGPTAEVFAGDVQKGKSQKIISGDPFPFFDKAILGDVQLGRRSMFIVGAYTYTDPTGQTDSAEFCYTYSTKYKAFVGIPKYTCWSIKNDPKYSQHPDPKAALSVPLEISATTVLVERRPNGSTADGLVWTAPHRMVRVTMVNNSDVFFRHIDMTIEAGQPIADARKWAYQDKIAFWWPFLADITPEFIEQKSGKRPSMPMGRLASTLGLRVVCKSIPPKDKREFLIAFVTVKDAPVKADDINTVLRGDFGNGQFAWFAPPNHSADVFADPPPVPTLSIKGSHHIVMTTKEWSQTLTPTEAQSPKLNSTDANESGETKIAAQVTDYDGIVAPSWLTIAGKFPQQ